MHPENRLKIASSALSGEIQLPNWPVTFSLVLGIESHLSGVHKNVLLSTRATSAGLVRASQLKQYNKIGGAFTRKINRNY